MKVQVLKGKDGRLLSPIQQARVFAQHSRSPLNVEEIIGLMSDEQAENFHEKWIVGFGHNSVAELATLPVDFAGISMIAAKAIEAWQRPGVAEKSTRMQEFGHSSFEAPDTRNSRLEPLVTKSVDLYQEMLEKLPRAFIKRDPSIPGAKLKRLVFDTARYLLPAGTRTSVGICAYPRDISEMVRTLGSNPNMEFRRIATALKSATEQMGGPLIRHTKPDDWYGKWLPSLPNKHIRNDNPSWTQNTVRYLGSFGGDKLLEAIRSSYGLEPFESEMGSRPQNVSVPHIFRKLRIQLHVVVDYGAFRDLQRHRRMEQYVELLTNQYGYETPDIPDPGLLVKYKQVMDAFCQIQWTRLPELGIYWQYYLPMAFRIGFEVDMDMEQLYYLTELRSRPQGHISYRRIAWEIAEQARSAYPWASQWLRVTNPDEAEK